MVITRLQKAFIAQGKNTNMKKLFITNIFFLSVLVSLEIYRIKAFQLGYSYTKNTQSSVFLYPGYLVKEAGRLFWYPEKPEFSNRWDRANSIEVTSCIFDPWPYTEGGEKFIMKVEQN